MSERNPWSRYNFANLPEIKHDTVTHLAQLTWIIQNRFPGALVVGGIALRIQRYHLGLFVPAEVSGDIDFCLPRPTLEVIISRAKTGDNIVIDTPLGVFSQPPAEGGTLSRDNKIHDNNPNNSSILVADNDRKIEFYINRGIDQTLVDNLIVEGFQVRCLTREELYRVRLRSTLIELEHDKVDVVKLKYLELLRDMVDVLILDRNSRSRNSSPNWRDLETNIIADLKRRNYRKLDII